MKKVLVLYHADCADGFCAAWVAHRHFGGDAEYLPVQYGQEPPSLDCRRTFILDFSYKRDVLLRMANETPYPLTILDHHKTAQADLEGLRHPTNANAFQCVFDLDKSGGRLAWEYFFPNEPSSWLVDFTEDRDLWKWKIEESREVNACLASWPRTFEEWDKLTLDSTAVVRFAVQGEAILRYQQVVVDAHCKHAVEIELDGHKVLTVNATTMISEIAGKLAEGRPFGSSYFIRDDGKKVWSLRSRDGGVDVSEIAKRRGGGGHRNAAGFEENGK